MAKAKKILTIFETVKNLTEADRLHWKEEADGTTFYTSVEGFKIYLAESVGTITFEVFNDQNEKLGFLEFGGYFDNTPALASFYESLKKRLQGMDDGLDELLEKLEGLK